MKLHHVQATQYWLGFWIYESKNLPATKLNTKSNSEDSRDGALKYWFLDAISILRTFQAFDKNTRYCAALPHLRAQGGGRIMQISSAVRPPSRTSAFIISQSELLKAFVTHWLRKLR